MNQVTDIDPSNKGKSPIFPTTHWSAIDATSQEERKAGCQAMTILLEKYYQPMELFVQMKFKAHLPLFKLEAMDLVQEFVHKRILEGEILKNVDRSKCNRFRNYLQTCLSNFVLERIRTTQAIKRSTTHQTISLEEHGISPPANHSAHTGAATAMDRLWAESLFLRCVDILKHQFEQSKRTKAWQLFDLRFLKPFLHGTPAVSYKDLAIQLGYPSNKAAADAMREIKDQWQRLVRKEISEYIQEKDLIEQELHHLITCLLQKEC